MQLKGDMMEVLDAIKTRRSIRRFTPQPVDDKILDAVLEAARWAPSWANSQSWRFIVVRDPGIKGRLAETLVGVLDGPNPAAKAINNAPVAIVACAEPGLSGYTKVEPRRQVTDKGDSWYLYDVALAMQNLTLAARSLGLGTVHVGSFNAGTVAEILGVPPNFRVVVMMPLGYPETEPAPRPRRELAELVFRDRFGEK
jgi:nitroreductase